MAPMPPDENAAMVAYTRDRLATELSRSSLRRVAKTLEIGHAYLKDIVEDEKRTRLGKKIFEAVVWKFFNGSEDAFRTEALSKFGAKSNHVLPAKKPVKKVSKKAPPSNPAAKAEVAPKPPKEAEPVAPSPPRANSKETRPHRFVATAKAFAAAKEILLSERGIKRPSSIDAVRPYTFFSTLAEADDVVLVTNALYVSIKGPVAALTTPVVGTPRDHDLG